MTARYYLSELAVQTEVDVQVSQADFEAALQDLVPSVSQFELEHYSTIQSQYSDNTG
jgi:peroxin-6